MLWAIDIGNTQTVVGIGDQDRWHTVWRFQTHAATTEDELAAAILALAPRNAIEIAAEGVVIASVVPPAEENWRRFSERYLGQSPMFLRTGAQVGLEVAYHPPEAVGADRIANALAALERDEPPVVVVDFGTATTFDCVNAQGQYQGGAIMPGIRVSLDSLIGRTAKLPAISIEAPEVAVGRNTVESLQSGIVLGYAEAIDGLARRIRGELGKNTTFWCTGGAGASFSQICREIGIYDANLTLDGLRIAWNRAADADLK